MTDPYWLSEPPPDPEDLPPDDAYWAPGDAFVPAAGPSGQPASVSRTAAASLPPATAVQRSSEGLRDEALAVLRDLTGRTDATFHDGQFEAIEALVADHRRALVVQRTGWGKSAVYFISALLQRRAG